MSAVLADTHAILWYLFEPFRLSAAATAAFDGAELAGSAIFVSAVTPIEVRYLVEKRRVPQLYLDDLLATLDDPVTLAREAPVTLVVARATEHIPRSLVPDLPDRIIAATAWTLGLPLVTADARIQSAPIPTVW